jgi:hypothetical protein
VTGATTGDIVTIVRDIPIARSSDYQTGGALLSETLNDDFDKLVMMAQQNESAINTRSIRFSNTSGDLPLPELVGDATARANMTLIFDADGNPALDDTNINVSTITDNIDKINTVAGDLNGSRDSFDYGSIASTDPVSNPASPTGALQGVYDIRTDITTVSGISANVTTVADNDTNITTIAGNMTAINNAQTAANNASADAASAEIARAAAVVAKTAAETAETNAETAETNAGTSETNAATSATSASTSASTATTQATSATASATSATASATSATSSASSATTSAATATTKATAASTSATNAATSETNAGTSETNAATSASGAATSATNAATSATSAETAYDNFDDRYLGQKSSDPSVDNDSNALLTGAIYFNTTSSAMKVYTGSAWTAVAPVATSVTASQISDVTATATELNYVDGVTSSIQTQLDGKQASGSYLAPTGDGSQLTNLPASGGIIEATASGALANGDKVILKADGTVEVVTQTSTILIPSSSNTSRDSFNSGLVGGVSISVDPTDSNKIAIGYFNALGGTDYPTVVLGTISGQSITFGTPRVVQSDPALYEVNVDFMNTTNKLVCSWFATGVIRAAVGTVTGTSVVFGSVAQPSLGYVIGHTACAIKGTDKIAIAYRFNNNARVHVGTVTGTSISFGGYSTLQDSKPLWVAVASNADGTKVAFSYRAAGTSTSPGYTQVGTVSGTSITFGSAQTFHSGGVTQRNKIAFNDNDQLAILYRDASNSDYGTVKLNTISGTTITLGNAYAFNSTLTYQGFSIHTHGSRFCLMVHEGNNTTGFRVYTGIMTGATISNTASYFLPYTTPSDGTADFVFRNSTDLAFVVRNSGSPTPTSGSVAMLGSFADMQTNLTADNYIGISDGAYANAATATVQVVGSTDDAQSGLTTGSKHYVQTDGTLSTTPDSPSVYAGVALSATKLLIKG